MKEEYNTEELLIIIIGVIMKSELGGTTKSAERLAEKLIYIMDNSEEVG